MPIHVSFLDCLRYVMAVIWFIYDDAMPLYTFGSMHILLKIYGCGSWALMAKSFYF